MCTIDGKADCGRLPDNPIMFASDGFIDVTGYKRRDIVLRNCRFLQGSRTDKAAVQRLRSSIKSDKQTVELVLNYRKNGEPFWNLLYVTPLLDESGRTSFFLGGQIDCSTTILGNPDVLRVLSCDGEDHARSAAEEDSSARRLSPPLRTKKSRFFRTLSTQKGTRTLSPSPVDEGAGMENNLIQKIGRMDLKGQMDAFETAYSKASHFQCLV